MVIPNFSGPLLQRMEKLNGILGNKSGIRLVGSSFGGLMASMFAMENESQVDRLILLAPAINLMPPMVYAVRKISVPVWIYHGKDDEVIPLKDVEPIAKDAFLNLSFNIVEDDHFLHKTFKTIDWDRLLEK
jgi:pimeloyl-ACP methyl ester carboxylesterase